MHILANALMINITSLVLNEKWKEIKERRIFWRYLKSQGHRRSIHECVVRRSVIWTSSDLLWKMEFFLLVTFNWYSLYECCTSCLSGMYFHLKQHSELRMTNIVILKNRFCQTASNLKKCLKCSHAYFCYFCPIVRKLLKYSIRPTIFLWLSFKYIFRCIWYRGIDFCKALEKFIIGRIVL